MAIEDDQDGIVRHLASGVLGENAPPPLAKGSLAQWLLWDGKNDQGRYVGEPSALTARVSLVPQPQFERNLYWSPYKRISESTPLIRAAPGGLRSRRRNLHAGSGLGAGADWFFGGVGFAGFNSSVAIVDSAGILIIRVGRYGNVDSVGAGSLPPLGGDGVGPFHACYVGAHTNHRLFISGVGNGRIVSVKLDYHRTGRVPLREVGRWIPRARGRGRPPVIYSPLRARSSIG